MIKQKKRISPLPKPPKVRRRFWRYETVINGKPTTEHEAHKRSDGNNLVKMKPEIQNMLAVEESHWNETWKR